MSDKYIYIRYVRLSKRERVRLVLADHDLDVAAPGDAVQLHAPRERSQTRRFVRVDPPGRIEWAGQQLVLLVLDLPLAAPEPT